MSSEGFKIFLKTSIPSNVPKNDPLERAFTMRRAIATFNLHWRDYRQVHKSTVATKLTRILSGGWDKTLKAMRESFGEDWEQEFSRITGEEAPGRHFYRNIYEEEEQKVT